VSCGALRAAAAGIATLRGGGADLPRAGRHLELRWRIGGRDVEAGVTYGVAQARVGRWAARNGDDTVCAHYDTRHHADPRHMRGG
jgi:hypothetical protein